MGAHELPTILTHRECHTEGRPVTDHALHRDLPAVQFNQALGQREA
jgi:hypothetical protein